MRKCAKQQSCSAGTCRCPADLVPFKEDTECRAYTPKDLIYLVFRCVWTMLKKLQQILRLDMTEYRTSHCQDLIFARCFPVFPSRFLHVFLPFSNPVCLNLQPTQGPKLPWLSWWESEESTWRLQKYNFACLCHVSKILWAKKDCLGNFLIYMVLVLVWFLCNFVGKISSSNFVSQPAPSSNCARKDTRTRSPGAGGRSRACRCFCSHL